ncbi:MAG: NACHT domain-containing protein [Cyanobacteria bacterium P01_A01_bin.80]
MKKLLNKSILLVICITIVGFFIGYIIKQLPTLEEFINVKEVEELVKILLEHWNVIAAFVILLLLSILFRYLQLQQQTEEVFEKITGTSSGKPRKSKPKNILIKKIFEEVNSRLAQSLHNRVYIILNQERDSTQVENPYDIDVKVGKEPKIRLKNTEITTIFDLPDVAGRLLILGLPGYGKTTMLLKLAEKLVERAKEDSMQPIPVLFSLSTWKNENQNIKDWLIEQLKEKYGVRKDIGKQWVDNEEIIPLLDGLDELAAERQKPCVEKINDFLQPGNWDNPLVVCSRTEEYQNYQTKLKLNTSLQVCSYTPQQVYKYLRDTKNEKLWDSINNNADLSDLARTPLFLNIIVIAAKGISIEKWQEFKYRDERLSYLFDAYINQMLARRYNGKKPTEKKIRDWLGWLAQTLVKENTTEFFIEHIQPHWLKNQFQVIVYKMNTWGIIFGILFSFITFAEIIGDFNNPKFNTASISIILFFWGGVGVFYGLIYGLISKQIRNKIEKINIPITIIRKLIYVVIWGLIIVLINEVARMIIVSNNKNIAEYDLGYIGFIFGFFEEFIGEDIQTVEYLKFNIKKTLKFYRLNFMFLIILFIFGMIATMFTTYQTYYDGYFFTLDNIYVSLFKAMYLYALVGVFLGIIFGFVIGIDGNEIENKKNPNQGIIQSIINTLILSFWSCTFAILLILLLLITRYDKIDLYSNEIRQVFFLVLTQCSIVGILIGILRSGTPVIKHFILRSILWLSGHTPWNYARFLDYCTNRLFLQRVGGSYRFMHDLLRQHFAKQYVESSKANAS